MAASVSLTALQTGLAEVDLLVAALPPPRPASNAPIRRAVARASVVMLSAHLERYVYGTNEEAVDYCNRCGVLSTYLPLALRLTHTRFSLEPVVAASWEKRADLLSGFVEQDGWLWRPGSIGSLQASRILAWMKAPRPKEIQRHYENWGIPKIFDRITRTSNSRSRIWYALDSLVTKRNAIAHGEWAETVSHQDIRGYRSAVIDFAERTDRAFARHLGRLCSSQAPW